MRLGRFDKKGRLFGLCEERGYDGRHRFIVEWPYRF
jgi:hypothetical protein